MWDLVHMLLDHLPDNRKHEEDQSWEWAWETLSSDAQEEVARIRTIVKESLKGAKP